MIIRFRALGGIGLSIVVLSAAACANGATDPAEGAGGADAPAEVREAASARETLDALSVLSARGWVRSASPPRVERAAHGRWAVAFPLERDGTRGALDLVYAADPKPAAVLRIEDESLRASVLGDSSAVPEIETACATGCDAPASSCVEWSCVYVSSIGLSFACLTVGNPLGVYHVVTRREGRTDPSQCALPYLDIHFVSHSCPAPSDAVSVFVCGWA